MSTAILYYSYSGKTRALAEAEAEKRSARLFEVKEAHRYSPLGSVLCGCGKRGCLESVVSIRHARKMLAEQAPERRDSVQDLTMKELFALSAAGDQPAQRVSCYLARCFAIALHNLSLAYNQEAVVFQGDFAWADDTFDRYLKKELREFRYYPTSVPFSIYYDKRDLALLAARGGAEYLKKHYFSSVD